MNSQKNSTPFRHQGSPSRQAHTSAAEYPTPAWLTNDILLPQQFFQHADRTRTLRGEVALLYAILDDAISCWQQGRCNKSQRAQNLAAEAESWLFTDDHHWTFSFVNVCAVLGLDPAYLRAGLRQWRPLHQTQQLRNCHAATRRTRGSSG